MECKKFGYAACWGGMGSMCMHCGVKRQPAMGNRSVKLFETGPRRLPPLRHKRSDFYQLPAWKIDEQ